MAGGRTVAPESGVRLNLSLCLEKTILDLFSNSSSQQSAEDGLELILVDKLCNQCFGTFTVSFGRDTTSSKAQQANHRNQFKSEASPENSVQSPAQLPDIRLKSEDCSSEDTAVPVISSQATPQTETSLLSNCSDSDLVVEEHRACIGDKLQKDDSPIAQTEDSITQDEMLQQQHLSLNLLNSDTIHDFSSSNPVLQYSIQDSSIQDLSTSGCVASDSLPAEDDEDDVGSLEDDGDSCPPQCRTCRRVFSSRPSLKRHVKLTHTAMPKAFRCALCGISTKLKHNLKAHYRSKHKMDDHSINAILKIRQVLKVNSRLHPARYSLDHTSGLLHRSSGLDQLSRLDQSSGLDQCSGLDQLSIDQRSAVSHSGLLALSESLNEDEMLLRSYDLPGFLLRTSSGTPPDQSQSGFTRSESSGSESTQQQTSAEFSRQNASEKAEEFT